MLPLLSGMLLPRNLWSSTLFADYHWFLFFGLQVTLPVLLATVLRNAAPMVISVLTLFGVEDTLYYLLQGYLPSHYSGVAILGIYEPSLLLVLGINVVGLLFSVMFVRRVCYAAPWRHRQALSTLSLLYMW